MHSLRSSRPAGRTSAARRTFKAPLPGAGTPCHSRPRRVLLACPKAAWTREEQGSPRAGSQRRPLCPLASTTPPAFVLPTTTGAATLSLASALSTALLLTSPSAPAWAQRGEVQDVVSGYPSITDGDTIKFSPQYKIRFQGVDTPETNPVVQTCKDADGAVYGCGKAATNALTAQIGDSEVTCELHGRDGFGGRFVGTCYANGEDLNRWMVRNGYGVAYRKFGDDYNADEDEARRERLGLWQGAFVRPDAFRRVNRKEYCPEDPRAQPITAATYPAYLRRFKPEDDGPSPKPCRGTPPQPLEDIAEAEPQPISSGLGGGGVAGCTTPLIKGNINLSGEKIYHVPGGASYNQVKIDKPGERFFCSVDEAVAAGWRPAGN